MQSGWILTPSSQSFHLLHETSQHLHDGLAQNCRCLCLPVTWCTRWFVSQNCCSTKPSGEAPQGTVWKRAGTFKKYLAGDRTNHLSITVYHRLTSANQISIRRVLPPGDPLSKTNSLRPVEEKSETIFSILKASSVFALLSVKNTLQFWFHWCYRCYTTLLSCCHCCIRGFAGHSI